MKPKFQLGNRVYQLLYKRHSAAGTVIGIYISNYTKNEQYIYGVCWDDSSWEGHWWSEHDLAPLASQELADAVQV